MLCSGCIHEVKSTFLSNGFVKVLSTPTSSCLILRKQSKHESYKVRVHVEDGISY